MHFFRKILFPFSVLYDGVTTVRNLFYDKGIFKAHEFNLPVIVVGNLSVGGTGKTPQIEYLIRLLQDKYKVATLSRGYKRKSKGFVLANKNATAETLGDEPLQYYQKFPKIAVAVDADRVNGINQLLLNSEKAEVILLDDAFQHRRVKAGFYILLTAYNDLYVHDFVLPAGNLRERRLGAKRANVIVVTKCPEYITESEQEAVIKKLKLKQQQHLFFTSVKYDDFIYSKDSKVKVLDIKNEQKLLLAGIAKPKPFFGFLKNENDETITFPDHHHFSDADIITILDKAKDKIIITTEKDYVRLKGKLPANQLFYLPIKSDFIIDAQKFEKLVFDFVDQF